MTVPDFYTDIHGNTVFTSRYHKNRGSCCENYCLHCPYGKTLEKFPLEMKINEGKTQFFLKNVLCAEIYQGKLIFQEHFEQQGLASEIERLSKE